MSDKSGVHIAEITEYEDVLADLLAELPEPGRGGMVVASVSQTPSIIPDETKSAMPSVVAPDFQQLRSKYGHIPFRAMLDEKATSDAAASRIGENLRLARLFKKDVAALFKEPTSSAYKLHTFLTEMAKTMCDIPDEVERHSESQLREWEKIKAENARRVQEQQQRQTTERHRAELQDALDNRLPWESEDEIMERFGEAPVVSVVVQSTEPDTYRMQQQGATFDIPEDKMAEFIKAVAGKIDQFPEVAEWLTLKRKPILDKCRQSEPWMKEHFPMVKIENKKQVRT